MTKKDREDTGVELYGMQQQLAKIQMGLEKMHDRFSGIKEERLEAESMLSGAKEAIELAKRERSLESDKVANFQSELDKLTSTLRQIENYNDQMKNEIAVTRRATYVAEESMSKMEKGKLEQDILIDNLQEALKRQHQQHQMYEAQLQAQKRETMVAQETLSEAQQEMESINFDKKQLVNQWKSSLIAMARRDEALQATEEALRQQREQEMAIEAEIQGYKGSIKKEQQKNEQIASVLQKVEGEQEFLKKQILTLNEKQEKSQKVYSGLEASLDQTEQAVAKVEAEKRAVEGDIISADKGLVKASQDIQAVESNILLRLSEQTTIEKGSQRTVKDTKELRENVKSEEMVVINLRNELAKIRVDILNSESHNGKLDGTIKALDGELQDKSKTIEKYEMEIRRRNDEIEKKTKEVDKLNRAYEKLTANMEDENTGPLEATVNNLNKEISQKSSESKNLQRQWVTVQTQLVGLQNENNTLKEKVQRLGSEQSVFLQKRTRLQQQFDFHAKEIKKLNQQVEHMHTDMGRLNQLISKHSSQQAKLANDNFNLETKIINQLKELENGAVNLETQISGSKEEKRDILAEIVELERQIMLWERKIQLEKETQAAIDPNVGNGVVTAMRKEIHRMKLRLGELLRYQEALIQDMERAIHKRDTIATKGRAGASKAKSRAQPTEAGLKKQTAELQRNIRDTDAEAKRAEEGVLELEKKCEELAEQLQASNESLQDISQREATIMATATGLQLDRARTLLQTAHAQHVNKYYDDWLQGGYQPSLTSQSAIEEIEHQVERRDQLRRVVEQLEKENPEVSIALTKVKALIQVEVYNA